MVVLLSLTLYTLFRGSISTTPFLLIAISSISGNLGSVVCCIEITNHLQCEAHFWSDPMPNETSHAQLVP